jgi:predicted O-methyltransferase YrrM
VGAGVCPGYALKKKVGSDMNKYVKKIRDHFIRDIINRTNDLETAVNVLIKSPLYVAGDNVGFNGGKGRKTIFQDLLNNYQFSTIIETGTYLGDTSAYMATISGLPVFTSELNPTLYALAKMRLKNIASVTLLNLDSRKMLTELSKNKEIAGKECFIFLDAHWGKDLPLKEEISIVASNFDKFILMIDDFQVPGDSGYAHDNYGTLDYIDMAQLKKKYNLCSYFPSAPSSEEPRPPTGCVVLARNTEYANGLRKIGSLKRYE